MTPFIGRAGISTHPFRPLLEEARVNGTRLKRVGDQGGEFLHFARCASAFAASKEREGGICS